jgi:hypothetical protein
MTSVSVVLIAAWFLLVLGAGAAGVFTSAPGRPPLALPIAVVAPLLAFGALYRAWPRFRRFALDIDLRWLTAIQAWRVLGLLFLALYAFGLLPGAFAWPAGLGDAAVGAAAPFVLLAMLRGRAGWPRQVAWLNIAGLLDFVVALGTGVWTSSAALGPLAGGAARAPLGALPLSLVPTFAVPLWIIFHLLSLKKVHAIARNVH